MMMPFKTWEENGYIEKVPGTPKEEKTTGQLIPHFELIKQDRQTTKIRPAVDCKWKFDGKAINDELLKGQNIFTDLRKRSFSDSDEVNLQ